MAEPLASTNPWLHLNWADVLLAEGDYEGAISRYRTIVVMGTDNIKARIAANNGRHNVVNYLLALGANSNTLSDAGWTPLLGAADEGAYDTVQLLLESGADASVKLGNRST